MKKLGTSRSELRDMLLKLWFDIDTPTDLDSDESDFSYNRVMGRVNHNYQRDAEMYKGKYQIFFQGTLLGTITTKPHRSLEILKQYNKYRIYSNLLEAVANEVSPGLRVTRG